MFGLPPAMVRQPVHPMLWTMAAVMAAIQLGMSLSEQGLAPLIFGPVWVYTLLAFFDPLFELARNGGPIEPQLIWSFVTHAFAHGGWMHLGLNAAVFLSLGHAMTRIAGIGTTLICFFACAVAGALFFAVIADFSGPLVGASGAVFGMIGMLTAWEEQALRRQNRSRQVVWTRVFALAAINIVMAIGFGEIGGALAWEAHLGGFVAGWLLAYPLQPRVTLHARGF